MRVTSAMSAGLITFTFFAIAGTANAEFKDCDAGKMCLWGNNDYKWMLGEKPVDQPIDNLYDDKDNEMDSWANRSSDWRGCMFGGHDGDGDKQLMRTLSSDDNVSPLNSDEVSSWRTRRGCDA